MIEQIARKTRLHYMAAYGGGAPEPAHEPEAPFAVLRDGAAGRNALRATRGLPPALASQCMTP